ncbi:hypothetical protein NBO_27g0048 [Nosema bombycis CQ1]|uniref:Uncharacterized protein n=1 Tax=Nosema bombycis (strain CQ1 / CVCC 102059) TaxID=578461 RepID=R0KUH5_NOSB1|nr:hypothetical protein NBO_27g0048 [Nosema bombycis CQ1]|eukprot:EOB14491.1 hypothetical protein NBO_27g0048 [Nosema bombycis CQ1]
MMTAEEKKKILEGLRNNKKKKQAYLQGVNYINEVLRTGVVDDTTFLKDLFQLMFQNSANERFMKKNTKKYTPETTFTLEKALINICYNI